MVVSLVFDIGKVMLFILLLTYFAFPSNCQVSSNCVFNATNENNTFNFSRLSKQDIWKAQIRNSVIAHISFCHPVHSSPCKDSTFCVSRQSDENWAIVISNNGPYKLKSQEKLRKVMLEVTSTEKCGSKDLNYSIQINFTCSSIDEDPVVLGLENDGCLLLVLWQTAAACPVVKECVHSAYDLSSLSIPTYYEVRTYNGRLFQLNLCRSVNNSSQCHSNNNNHATACEIIQKDNKTQIIGQFDRQSLTVVEDAGLTLQYTTKGKGPKTVIQFICNADSKDSTPNFVKSEGKTYHFEVETPLACSFWPQECVAFDKKRRFDLKPLRKSEDNWVVQSMSPGAEYYINICGPLNPIPDLVKNTDGSLEACLIYKQNKTVINLGTAVGGPSLTDNVLTLQFTGGSPCPGGGRHRVQIEFSCVNKTFGSPVYIKTTEECVHHFSWGTVVACPTLFDVAKNCKVKEVQYGYLYDLSSLHSGFDKLKTSEKDSYRINLCGPLETPCNNKNANVCLVQNGKEIAIGYESTSIYYENGGLRFVSRGEPCNKNFNESTVTILLPCQHGSDLGSPGLPTQMGCNFYFVWYTSATCPTPRFTPCTVEDNGNFYDLSQLSESVSNHVVFQRDDNLKFIINVCHSVVFGTEATCEYSSGACMLDMDDLNPTTRFTNIGDVKNGPYIDTDKKLKLKYEQGKICPFQNGPDHISTIITFECAQEDSLPLILPGDVCLYEFLWKTKAACPQKGPTESHGLSSGDCTVLDPLTEDRFDLRILQNKVQTVADLDGHSYTFVVCGNLTNSSCGSGVGVCQEKTDGGHEHWSAGVGNGRLQYRPHALLLEYKDGSPCKNNLTRSTTIEFVCAEETLEEIVFIEETQSCSYLISWHTALACSRTLYEDCYIAGKRSIEVDLTPLIRRSSNYIVKTDKNTVFFINVCRPLLPVPGLACAGGPSVCMAYIKNGNYYEEKNIGYHGSLQKRKPGEVVIIYDNGLNPNTSAEINLVCDITSGIGEPQFQNIMKNSNNQSKYHFVWKTNVTCEPRSFNVPARKENCIIYNDQVQRSLDLREFGHRGVIEVHGPSLKYVVDFCGSIRAERSTKDGPLSNMYGTLTNVIFYYQQQQAVFHFTGGSVCSDDSPVKPKSDILLSCIPRVKSKKPTVLREYDCSVVIEWQNPLICELLMSGYPRHVPHIEEEESEGSSVGLVLGLLVLVIVAFSLLMYFRKQSNRSQLRNRFSSFFRMRHSGEFHYSRLEAADEASQLLASHMDGQDSDSDDELLRM